jgi:type II secretory pathway pseudopilin PulG
MTTTTQQPHHGISLLEVLAAIFVVTIGLLGVLAVIPFGAYQVSKAQHAELAANMLANACEEIFVREMAKNIAADDTKFIWFEPNKTPVADSPITVVADPKWREIMRGQDDLDYKRYSGKDPDFADEPKQMMSTGSYTWFFTFLPPPDEEKTTVVDVLACYRRVSDDDVQAADCAFVPSNGGGMFMFPDATYLERLTETKYVFATWTAGTPSKLSGAWCKIVFVDKSNSASPRAIVTGNLPKDKDVLHVYIPSGVLYHKRIENVMIR